MRKPVILTIQRKYAKFETIEIEYGVHYSSISGKQKALVKPTSRKKKQNDSIRWIRVVKKVDARGVHGYVIKEVRYKSDNEEDERVCAICDLLAPVRLARVAGAHYTTLYCMLYSCDIILYYFHLHKGFLYQHRIQYIKS